MTSSQVRLKRAFDFSGALLGLLLFWWLILLAWIVASLDTRRNGLFTQKRVGQHGRIFNVFKIRTMRELPGVDTTITQSGDARITRVGAFMRRYKLDELPQLWNVLKGDMSFVGPRPDVPGYADRLQGNARALLTIKPGITGPATLAYRNEEALLAAQSDPAHYNDTVIYPDKVRINLDYMHHWSLARDLNCIWQTIKGN